MRVKKWLPYLGVVIPWVIVGLPMGLVIPILILDIPLLDVPFWHKAIDIAVLLAVSLLLGMVFTAIDARLGYVGTLYEHCLRRVKRED